MTIINGESFGKYKVLSKVGKGGMGEVYLAQDTKLDRRVAIKFLRSESASSPSLAMVEWAK